MTDLPRMLLVEDEPLIAMMLEDFLQELDRRVVGSADCVSGALTLIEAGGIDAAIHDVNLRGGEKSWPVADALAERGIPFILATGGADDGVRQAHLGRPVLQKPFTMDGIERALARLEG